MQIPNFRTKRKRGVVLSESGWQRLQHSKRQSENLNNRGITYTLEELVKITGLSQNTLTRIHSRKTAVDRQSLQSYFKAFGLTFCDNDNDYIQVQIENSKNAHQPTIQGLVPLNSPFYIERQPIEQLCYETIRQPGSLITIKAPALMGKTSLMARILWEAKTYGMKTVTLSLQLADTNVFSDLNSFLQWFCAVVAQSLKLPLQLADYWDDIFGAKYNCTYYFENYLLANHSSCFVLSLDNVDILFQYPQIATDFFRLLRAWYEKSKYSDDSSSIWQKLRLLVVFSTEVEIPLNLHQSLLNVGLSVDLPEFNQEQILSLAVQHHLNWKAEDAKEFLAKVGGNPYLVRLAFDKISSLNITIEELLEGGSTEREINNDYQKGLSSNLQPYSESTGYHQFKYQVNPITNW